MSDYTIAIASFNRPETIVKASLSTLKSYNIPADKVIIFVATQEEYDKYPSGYKKVIGELGLKNIRNFMTNYFEEGQKVFYMDDDIYGFYIKNAEEQLERLEDLDSWILKGFSVCKCVGARLFGLYPVHNAYFMRDEITTHLTFIVGCAYGVINDKTITNECNAKDDYERDIKYYLKYGSIVRFGNTTIKTKYYTEKGGLQTEGHRTPQVEQDDVNLLLKEYPDYVKVNNNRKSDSVQIKMIGTKKKVYNDIQERLLKELRSMKWSKNTSRGNVAGFTDEVNSKGKRIAKPCLSYTFGRFRPRRAKKGVYIDTAITEKKSELFKLLKDYAEYMFAGFEFTTITVNKDIICEPHTDKYNIKPSVAIGLGDYTGGMLHIEGRGGNDIRYRPLLFNGKSVHWTDDFEGERFSLIYYSL